MTFDRAAVDRFGQVWARDAQDQEWHCVSHQFGRTLRLDIIVALFGPIKITEV